MKLQRPARLLCLAFLLAGLPGPKACGAAYETSANLLDINTATPQQLKALPGFGDAYVKRVIAGRPYTAKNQLVTRGTLPQSAYARIAALIIAHRPSR